MIYGGKAQRAERQLGRIGVIYSPYSRRSLRCVEDGPGSDTHAVLLGNYVTARLGELRDRSVGGIT